MPRSTRLLLSADIARGEALHSALAASPHAARHAQRVRRADATGRILSAPGASGGPGPRRAADCRVPNDHDASRARAGARGHPPARAAGHPRIAVHAALVGSQHIGCTAHARTAAAPAGNPGNAVAAQEGMGAAFHFNPATGMLENPGGSGGEAMSKSRFVESSSTGGFRRVGGGPGGGGDDDAAGIQRSVAQRALDSQGDLTMRAVAVAVQSVVVWLGFMTQGLLAGFGVLHVFMTYYMDDAQTDGFLHYYSPIAVPAQRCFVTLSALALITAVDKYARDSLSGFMLQGFTLQKVDALAVLSFFLCFVLSVVCVPFEDRVFYANKRVPSWWEYESGDVFVQIERRDVRGDQLRAVLLRAAGLGVRVLHEHPAGHRRARSRGGDEKRAQAGTGAGFAVSTVKRREGTAAGTGRRRAGPCSSGGETGTPGGGNGGGAGRRQRMDGYGR